MNAVSSCFPLSETATTDVHSYITGNWLFFYPYVTQILKQKYIFKDLFITHEKKTRIIMQPHSHAPLSLFLEGGREKTLGTSSK